MKNKKINISNDKGDDISNGEGDESIMEKNKKPQKNLSPVKKSDAGASQHDAESQNKQKQDKNKTNESKEYVVVPLRDIVVFPKMVAPLFIGRKKSVEALDKVASKNCKIMLLTQKDSSVNDPGPNDLYKVGTLTSVLQLLKLPDGTLKALVEGEQRVRVDKINCSGSCYSAFGTVLEEVPPSEKDEKAMQRTMIASFENYIKQHKKTRSELLPALSQITAPGQLADSIAVQLSVGVESKQEILEQLDVSKRVDKVSVLIENEIGILDVEKRIRSRVKKQMEKNQREYYLSEQIKAIQKELGEGEEAVDELSLLKKKIKRTKLSKEAKQKAVQELNKLKMMSPMSAEATVVRNYLDWLLSVPWNVKGKVKDNLEEAEEILNRDHYGLERVKERVLEYLAVQKRATKIKGSIICLVGPPGVGKTSLGRSLAEATGREFVRLSLGGIRDESEIRGHRRTYIGSMPGRIIQSMKKSKTTNPLFLLDEIDKIGADFRGDPSAALLEVLDPSQNNAFNDHYLEVDYDLSSVMFIATANNLNIPDPLKDRMEIIRIAGYTEEEKIQIFKRYIMKKQIEAHYLKEKEIEVTDGVVRDIIRYYTREAGVRGLEKEMANLCRKSVLAITKEKPKIKSIKVTSKNLHNYAGVRKFSFGEVEKEKRVGIVTGLAWTEAGGDLLTIEALMMQGKGKMIVTGNLRDVMKESISAANSYVKANAAMFGISTELFASKDIHVHVPEGATPKDGPSAGIAMITAIVSVMTAIPVHNDIAMTGEITLRGRILPIGGLKEKLLAALRGGIKKVFMPRDNIKDMAEIPNNVKTKLEVIPVATVGEVISQALIEVPKPIDWDNHTEAQKKDDPKIVSSQTLGHIRPH